MAAWLGFEEWLGCQQVTNRTLPLLQDGKWVFLPTRSGRYSATRVARASPDFQKIEKHYKWDFANMKQKEHIANMIHDGSFWSQSRSIIQDSASILRYIWYSRYLFDFPKIKMTILRQLELSFMMASPEAVLVVFSFSSLLNFSNVGIRYSRCLCTGFFVGFWHPKEIGIFLRLPRWAIIPSSQEDLEGQQQWAVLCRGWLCTGSVDRRDTSAVCHQQSATETWLWEGNLQMQDPVATAGTVLVTSWLSPSKQATCRSYFRCATMNRMGWFWLCSGTVSRFWTSKSNAVSSHVPVNMPFFHPRNAKSFMQKPSWSQGWTIKTSSKQRLKDDKTPTFPPSAARWWNVWRFFVRPCPISETEVTWYFLWESIWHGYE